MARIVIIMVMMMKFMNIVKKPKQKNQKQT